MNQTHESEVKTKSKSYILVTGEYLGTSDFKYMLRSELRSNESVTLFLLGIPDPAIVYSSQANSSQDEITKNLFQVATDSIVHYLKENELVEGNTYYGEYMADNLFHISAEKPTWEDGHWGQKI